MLVLDSLPCGEVCGVLIAVFPDGAPRLKEGTDLCWCGEAEWDSGLKVLNWEEM